MQQPNEPDGLRTLTFRNPSIALPVLGEPAAAGNHGWPTTPRLRACAGKLLELSKNLRRGFLMLLPGGHRFVLEVESHGAGGSGGLLR